MAATRLAWVYAREYARYARLFFSVASTVAFGLIFIKDNIVFPFQNVRGRSMAPSLNPKYHETGTTDRLRMRKWGPAYELKRGDVVSFWTPHNPNNTAIKRVIATEGDLVYPHERYPSREVRVPHGHVWVEGDSHQRGTSRDSNDYGPISMNLIEGKALRIVWPPNRRGPIPDNRKKRTLVIPGDSELPDEYMDF